MAFIYTLFDNELIICILWRATRLSRYFGTFSVLDKPIQGRSMCKIRAGIGPNYYLNLTEEYAESLDYQPDAVLLHQRVLMCSRYSLWHNMPHHCVRPVWIKLYLSLSNLKRLIVTYQRREKLHFKMESWGRLRVSQLLLTSSFDNKDTS